MPDVYNQLREITSNLEKHYKDMQDFEFTVEEGKLYMLQTRNGKRTGPAAVRVAVEMVDEGLIEEKRPSCASRRRSSISCCTRSSIRASLKKLTKLATGIDASPGAAVGRVAFTAEDAVEMSAKGPVILIRKETTPDDIHGMDVAKGILTAVGGKSSHAAVVARGMGRALHRRRGRDPHQRARKAVHREGRRRRPSPSRKATGFPSTAPPATSIWARPRPRIPIRTRPSSRSS